MKRQPEETDAFWSRYKELEQKLFPARSTGQDSANLHHKSKSTVTDKTSRDQSLTYIALSRASQTNIKPAAPTLSKYDQSVQHLETQVSSLYDPTKVKVMRLD